MRSDGSGARVLTYFPIPDASPLKRSGGLALSNGIRKILSEDNTELAQLEKTNRDASKSVYRIRWTRRSKAHNRVFEISFVTSLKQVFVERR